VATNPAAKPTPPTPPDNNPGKPQPLAILDMVAVREKALTVAMEHLAVEIIGDISAYTRTDVQAKSPGDRLGYKYTPNNGSGDYYQFDIVKAGTLPNDIGYFFAYNRGSQHRMQLAANPNLWRHADAFADRCIKAPFAFAPECIRYVETVPAP
jgi:hypothetical protein